MVGDLDFRSAAAVLAVAGTVCKQRVAKLLRMSVEGSHSVQSRPLVHDLPVNLKSSRIDSECVSYSEFRATLTPRYARVWRDIMLGWLVVAGVLVLVTVFD